VSGIPFELCVEALLPGLTTRHPELLDTLSGCEQAVVERDGGEFYEGAVETVTRLSHDFPVFLVSNCQEWYLRLFLDFSGLGPVLDGCDCHSRSGKPKSEMLADVKRSKSLSAPVYIGDTPADAAAAGRPACPTSMSRGALVSRTARPWSSTRSPSSSRACAP